MIEPKKILLLLLATLAANLPATAQKGKDKKKEKEKVPVYNYVIDDPMDVFGRQPVPPDVVKTILLPEFLSQPKGTKTKDTVLRYECYNTANNIILPDTLNDYQALRYVSLIKTYTDPIQKYKDADGNLQPLPIQKIIYRYDKVGADKWLSVNYATNKQATLEERVKDIIHTDTAGKTIAPAGNYIITIRKYYRVSPVK